MRIHHLLLLSLLSGAAALKGETALRARTFGRGLQENGESDETGLPTKDGENGGGGPPMKGAEKGGTEETKLPEKGAKTGKDAKAKDPKKEGKDAKSKKEGKDAKSKKAKKCKKAKKSKAKPSELVMETSGGEEIKYCLHSQRSPEECAALREGKVPKGNPKVEGDVNMEIVYNDSTSPDRVLREVEDILRKETPPKYVGCVGSRRLNEETDETDAGGEDLSVTGVDFMRLMISEEGTLDQSGE